jgi:hypothetical protein
MSFVLDMSDVQGGFDALPAGRYHVAVTDWDNAEVQNEGKLPAGTPGINWEFTVQEGEYEGRKLWTNHWIHPKTLGFLKAMLKNLSKDGEPLYSEEDLESDNFELDADEVVGAEAIAVVTVRAYQGEDRNNIKRFTQLTEGTDTPTSSMLP